MGFLVKELSGRILGCAFRVHSELGPGLLEAAYKACLMEEFRREGLNALLEVPIPIVYKGTTVDCSYRADCIVEDQVLLELKSVESLLPIHEAQVLTYLRLSRLPVGLLLNFNSRRLKDAMRRLVI